MQTYAIIKQSTPNSFWSNPPKSRFTLQRALQASDGDLQCFIIGVLLTKDKIEHFMTPKTETDGMYWSNGLSRTSRLGEAFRLFPSVQEASDLIDQMGLLNATVYRFVRHPEEMSLILERVEKTSDSN